MKKKQRVLARILATVMSLSFIPFSAFAEVVEDPVLPLQDTRSGDYSLVHYKHLYNEDNDRYLPDYTYRTAPVYNREIFNIINQSRNGLAANNPLGSISATTYVHQRYWSGPYGQNADPSIGGLYIPGGVYFFSDAEENGDMHNMMQKFESFNGRSITHSLIPGYSYSSKNGGSWFVNFEMRPEDDRTDFFGRLNPEHLYMFIGAELKGGAKITVGDETFIGTGDHIFSTKYDITDEITFSGSSSSAVVSEPWFMLIDNTPPSIIDVNYSRYSAFGEEFSITFDENIRLANFDLEAGIGDARGSVTFTYADKNSGTEIGTVTGTINRLWGDDMYFSVPGFKDSIAGKEIIITKIEDWDFPMFYGDDALDFNLYGMVREPEVTTGYHTYFETGNKTWPWMNLENYANSAYSDLAGNPINVEGTSLTSYGLEFDELAPSLESVSIIHDKVSVDSSIPKDEWPDDINRENLFLGNGESFAMKLQFSEQVSSINEDNVQIELNILDDSDQPVIARPENVDHYGDYAIVSGFSLENSSLPVGTDEPIHIAKITYNVSDLASNSTGNIVLTGDDVPKPREQLYIDTVKPEVNIAYIADATEGEGFTASIDFTDPAAVGQSVANVSGILGKDGLVWLSTRFSAESLLSYSYAVTDSLAWPSESEFTGSSELGDPGTLSSSPYSIPIKVTGDTKYLHVKFDVVEDAVMIEPRVSGSVTDWAGNKSDPSLSSAIMSDVIIDTSAPIITETSARYEYNYSGSEATITYRFAADHKFNYSGAGEITVTGEWSDGSGSSIPTMVGSQYEFEKTTTATDDHSITVTAVDSHGNESTLVSSIIPVNLEKPSADYEVISGTNEPVLDPVIKVTAPVASQTGDTAYTRVRIGFDGKSYMTVLQTGDSIENIFDIDERQWYHVGNEIFYYDGGHTFTAATKLPIGTPESPSNLANLVTNYNGIIEVEVDHAFADLTPVLGASVDPMTGNLVHTSYQRDNEIFIKKLSNANDVHGIDFDSRPRDSNSEELENASYFTTFFGGKSLVGSYAEFSIVNEIDGDWSIEGIDFENSFVEILDLHNVDQDGAPTLVETRPLLESATQKLVFSHETDGVASYTFRVTIANMGGGTSTIDAPYLIIVDNHTPKFAGDWEVEFNFNNLLFGNVGNSNNYIRTPEQINTNDNVPFAPMIVNIAKSNPYPSFVSQNDEHAEYKSTANRLTIELFVDSNYTVSGFEGETEELVGVVETSRMWNVEQPGAIPDYDSSSGHPENGLSERFGYSENDVVDTVAELEDKSEGAMIVNNHVNTMNYQFKFENGNESPVYEIVIDTRDVQEPQVSFNIDPTISNRLNPSNDVQLLYSADLYVDSIFTPMGNANLYAVTTSDVGTWKINGDEKDRFVQSSIGIKYGDTVDARDVVTLNKELYVEDDIKNIANGDSLEYVNFAFVATDEVGNSTVIIPQFRDPESAEPFPVKYAFDDVLDEDVALNYGSSTVSNSLKYEAYTLHMPIAMNLDKTTITVTVDGTEYTYPAVNPPIPNEAGFIGVKNTYNTDDTEWRWSALFALPLSDDPDFEKKEISATVNVVGENEQSIKVPVEFDSKYALVSTDDISIFASSGLLRSNLVGSLDGVTYEEDLILPIYKAGNYAIPFYDYFGNQHTANITVDSNTLGFTSNIGSGINVSFSTTDPTSDPVVVDISSVSGEAVNIEENSNASFTNNGTPAVVATVAKNAELIVRYTETNGDAKYVKVVVDNIKPEYNPTIVWDYDDSDISTVDHEGNPVDPFIYGTVTATVVDEAWGPVDFFTGSAAEHTFYPNGGTSHTFEVKYLGNPDPVEVTATISGFELKERPTLTLPTEEEYVDATAPSLQLLPYVSTNGSLFTVKPVTLKLEQGPVQVSIDTWSEVDNDNDGEIDDVVKSTTVKMVEVNSPLTEHTGYTDYTSGDDFVNAIGWGTNIRIQVETTDEDDVDLVLKEGSPITAPSYGDANDTIAGVVLSGRTLDISQNAQFTLYAIDKSGNTEQVSLNFANIGEAPVPSLVKTFPEANKVRVYLIGNAADAFDDLVMSDTVKTGTETSGEYNGYDYVDFTANTQEQIPYSYTYRGATINGILYVTITEIDTVKPTLVATTWSANKNFVATNKVVTATLDFSKEIVEAGTVGNAPVGLEYMISGKRVTLRYSENAPKIKLVYQSANGLGGTVEIDAVNNIDMTAPTIEHSIAVSADKRSATITLTAKEEVVISELGQRGTSFEVEVTENGTYSYNFTDIAGNKGTTHSVTVNEIEDIPLSLSFATDSAGTNATTDPNTLALNVGATIYIMANRASDISLNDISKAYSSGWLGFVITEAPSYVIFAKDAYGHTEVAVLQNIKTLDVTAPVLALDKEVLSASMESSEAELRTLLIGNAHTRDDKDSSPTIDVIFTKPTVASTVEVVYTSTDDAGNVSEKTGYLKLYDGTQPVISLNGEEIYEDYTYTIDKDELLRLTVDLGGEPYSVMYEAGLKTVAQVKIGSTDVVHNVGHSNPITLDITDKSGFYTVVITAQNRMTYRFIVYVR